MAGIDYTASTAEEGCGDQSWGKRVQITQFLKHKKIKMYQLI